MKKRIKDTQASYDRVALEYGERYKDEMDDKPSFIRVICLPDADNSWGGIAAFYCIIHIPREQIVDALGEMNRVLKPGGVLLITFHIGKEIKHLDEWWERPVNLDFAFYEPAEMETWLKEAGYELEKTLVREPNPEVEVATRRAYLFEKKPKV